MSTRLATVLILHVVAPTKMRSQFVFSSKKDSLGSVGVLENQNSMLEYLGWL